MSAASEVDAFMAGFTLLTAPQRRVAARALCRWVRARSRLPDADPRVVQLLREVDRLVAVMSLRLDDQVGLRVDPMAAWTTALVLERGQTWLPGGDWQRVVLTAVSMKSQPPPHT